MSENGTDVPPSPDKPRGLDRQGLQERAIHGALWTLVNTVIGVGVGFLVNILLARSLGVVDYGRLAYLTMVIGVLGSVAAVGMDSGIVQYGAKAHARGDTAAVQSLLAKAQGFRLLVSAPAMTLVVIALVRIDWATLLLAVVFGIWVQSAVSGAPDALTIENKTATGAQNAMLVNLVTQVAVVAVALTVATADSIWVVRTIAGSVGVLAAVPFISREYRKAVLRPRLPRNFPAGFWRFAIPAGLAGIIGSLVANRTEVAILTWMSASAAAGLYALAFGLAGHLFSPAQALVGPLIPAVSGLREIDESAVSTALGRTLRASATAVGLLLGAAMPAFAILVPPIYGADYAAVPPVLLALGISGGLGVLAGPVFAFVQARLQGRRLLRANMISLVVDLGLAVALIPFLGVWGATLANIAGTVIRLGILLGGELTALSMPWTVALRDLAPVLFGGLACWTAWLTADALGTHFLLSSLIAGLLGAALTVVLMRVTHTGMSVRDTSAILHALPQRLASAASPLVRLVSNGRDE